jgi:hypothetical protein
MGGSQVILTRFNCRFGAAWTSVAIDPAWLSPRFDLFDRYCLPAVRAQDCQEFKWILFFDEETPEPFKTRAASLACSNIVPLFVGNLSGDLIRQTIRDHIPPGATHVITSRLDNDDGLAVDYVRRLREAFRPVPHKEYLNLTEGFIVSNGRLYRRRDPHNAFVSLVEPVEGKIEGVWTYPHPEIGQHAPVRQVGGGPGWLQVVHGANVSNKVRGWRVNAGQLGDKFVVNRSELVDPTIAESLWEHTGMAGTWAARDAAAGGVRRLKRLMGRGWKPT